MVVLEPVVKNFYYSVTSWGVYSGITMTIYLMSQGTRIWELTVDAPQQFAGAKGGFRKWIWDTDGDATKGESASKAVAICLQDAATKMAQDNPLRDSLLELRDTWTASHTTHQQADGIGDQR